MFSESQLPIHLVGRTGFGRESRPTWSCFQFSFGLLFWHESRHSHTVLHCAENKLLFLFLKLVVFFIYILFVNFC